MSRGRGCVEAERFYIQMTIVDKYGEQKEINHAIPCDEAMRISARDVESVKQDRFCGVSTMGVDQLVTMIRTKEFRRDYLKIVANRLAGQLADRLEDAEGWHDESRIEPAREALGTTRGW